MFIREIITTFAPMILTSKEFNIGSESWTMELHDKIYLKGKYVSVARCIEKKKVILSKYSEKGEVKDVKVLVELFEKAIVDLIAKSVVNKK